MRQATLSNGLPVWTRRKSGYITQTLLNECGGCRAKALECLNEQGRRG